jgi:hypothetical protein
MAGQPKISPITSSKTIHFSFRPKKNNYFSSNNIPTRGLTDSQTLVRAEAFISKTRGVFTKQSIKAVAGLTISVIKVIVANSLEKMNKDLLVIATTGAKAVRVQVIIKEIETGIEAATNEGFRILWAGSRQTAIITMDPAVRGDAEESFSSAKAVTTFRNTMAGSSQDFTKIKVIKIRRNVCIKENLTCQNPNQNLSMARTFKKMKTNLKSKSGAELVLRK